MAPLPQNPRESFYGVLSLPLFATLVPSLQKIPCCKGAKTLKKKKKKKKLEIWFPSSTPSAVAIKWLAHFGNLLTIFKSKTYNRQSKATSFGGKKCTSCFSPPAQVSKSPLRQTRTLFPTQCWGPDQRATLAMKCETLCKARQRPETFCRPLPPLSCET